MRKIVFIYIGIILIVCLMQLLNSPAKIKEGYESLDTCIAQGYPKWFCMNVPIQACLTNCD